MLSSVRVGCKEYVFVLPHFIYIREMKARVTFALILLYSAIAGADFGPGFVRDHVRVDWAEISYVIRQRSGPVLVLVPGSLVGADDWAGVVASLDPDLTIMIVELRGHGASWPPPENGTIESFANDVMQAIGHAGVGRLYVGGHSIGGMIAIEVGGRHPERVKGIVAIEGWTHYSVAQEAFGGQNDRTLSAEQKERRDELRKPVMSRWTPEQIKGFTSVWRKWNGLDVLKQTPVPVLELWGDRNQPHPTRAQMQIPDRPNIELQWIAGASHFLPLERPAEVAAAVNGFIRRVEKGASQ
jgi:3-oxoadipate enol-lactonase